MRLRRLILGRCCCPAHSIWTSAMPSLGVLHTFHCTLHKKGGMFFLALMYPRLGRAKKRSILHGKFLRYRCSWLTLRRSTSFWGPLRRETCLFVSTRSVCRPKSPVEGVFGANKVCPARMQPSWSAEYSQKCTVLAGGPVRAGKTMPMSPSTSSFCCTDFSEYRARISQPGSRGGPEGMKFAALQSAPGATAKLSPGIQKI